MDNGCIILTFRGGLERKRREEIFSQHVEPGVVHLEVEVAIGEI